MHQFLLSTIVFCLLNGVMGNRILETSDAYYKYNETEMTWDDAKVQCEQEGATLFFPEDETEVKQVQDIIQTAIWVGLHWKNDRYQTIDGRRMKEVYHKWYRDAHHQNFVVFNCVILFNDGDLTDHICDGKEPFICKTIKTVVVETTTAKTTKEEEVPTPTAQSPHNTEKNQLTHETNVCNLRHTVIDNESASHSHFGKTIGDELKKFPTNEKLQVMIAITKMIQEHWSKIQNDCTENESAITQR